jgi:hypothetical protein
MRLYDVRCPECGGTRKAMERSMVLMCEYCGAYIGLSRDMESSLDMSRRVMQYVRSPTDEWTRYNELSVIVSQGPGDLDREAFRAVLTEYYSLYAMLYPEYVPARGRDAIRDWLREAVAGMLLVAYDPDVKRAFQAYTAMLGHVQGMRQSPVQWARGTLDAAERYYSALTGHPDCPQGVFVQSPRHYARKALESSLAGLVNMMGPERIDLVRKEVLGMEADKKSAALCPECAAPLPPGRHVACPFCGTALLVETEDEWVTQNAALFAHVLDSATDMTADGAVMTALGFIVSALGQGVEVPADRAAAFLRKTVPWAAPDRIMGQAGHLFSGSHAPYLGTLGAALAGWSPSGSPPTFGKKEPAAADPGSAWSRELLRMWQQGGAKQSHASGQDRAMALLSNCLYPFHVGGACTPQQALEFIGCSNHGCSTDDLRRALSLMKSAYGSDPRILGFLQEMEKGL